MLSKKKEAFWQLPAKKISDILQRLYEIRLQSDDEDIYLPLITLHLVSGRDITGHLIQRNADRHNTMSLLMHTGKHPVMNALYVPESRVEAVTVHDMERYIDLLSFGKFWYIPGSTPPTRLDIKKKIGDYKKVLGEEFGKEFGIKISAKGMPESDEPLRLLYKALHDTILVVRKMAKDDFAKEVLTDNIEKILFQAGKANKVILAEKSLKITTDMENWEEGFLTRYELRDIIENLLQFKEKSFLKRLKDETLPSYQKTLREYCGYDITYEVNWKSFEEKLDSMQYFEHQGLSYINQVFNQLRQEETLKGILEKEISKIVIKCTSKASDKKLTLNEKVLTIESCWGGDSSGYFKVDEIQQKLEGLLSDFD